MVKKDKLSFFYAAHNVLPTPLPFHFYFSPLPQFYYFPSSIFLFLLFPPPVVLLVIQYYFRSSFLNSLLLYNFDVFPSPPRSCFPPPQFLLFSLLNLDFPAPPPPHLFYIFFHPQRRGPHIDPISTLHQSQTQVFFNTAS